MQESDTALAKLTFNAAAAREVFTDTAKGLRLRIERSSVMFRSAVRRGDDVIAIERRARGIMVPVEATQRRLMDRLYKAGLTEDQPYFTVEPAMERGWWGLVHSPDQPPRLQPSLRVSQFDPPPMPVDMAVWRRFWRAVTTDRPVNEDLWQTFRRMVITALAVTSRPVRGRQSNERMQAARLLNLIDRNILRIEEWSKGQELAGDVTELLLRVRPEPWDEGEDDERPSPTGRRRSQVLDLDDVVTPGDRVTDVSADYVARVLKPKQNVRRGGRRPSVEDEDVRRGGGRHAETGDSDMVPPRRTRRRRGMIEPVILDDEPLPEDEPEHETTPLESSVEEVSFAEVIAEIMEGQDEPEDEGQSEEPTISVSDADDEPESDGESDEPEPKETERGLSDPLDVTFAEVMAEIAEPEEFIEGEVTEVVDEPEEAETDQAETTEPVDEGETPPVEGEIEEAPISPEETPIDAGEDEVEAEPQQPEAASGADAGVVTSEEAEPTIADEVETTSSPEPNEATDAEEVVEQEAPPADHDETSSADHDETSPADHAESPPSDEKKADKPPIAGLGDQPDID